MKEFYDKLEKLLKDYNVTIEIITSYRILAGEYSPRLVSEIYVSHPDLYYCARIPIDKKDLSKPPEEGDYKSVNLLRYVKRFAESYDRHTK